MIVFATSDKGGTGRSVTSCNLAYRLSMRGTNTAYVDFDFGSPTAGALFEISAVERGTTSETGIHAYLRGRVSIPQRINVRDATDREALRKDRSRGGRLVLLPGDEGGGEAVAVHELEVVRRCRDLLLDLDQRFKVVLVDLSSGRSVAMQLALQATTPELMPDKQIRWLVFHRWTRQHIVAADGLVTGANGLLDVGVRMGYDREELASRIRFVRTAVPAVNTVASAARGAQAAWLLAQDDALDSLAADLGLSGGAMLGKTPVEPVLQWREQLILETDVGAGIANIETIRAFESLADTLTDSETWVRV